jgi:hypothetical protein
MPERRFSFSRQYHGGHLLIQGGKKKCNIASATACDMGGFRYRMSNESRKTATEKLRLSN